MNENSRLKIILAKAMGGRLPPLPVADLDKSLNERRQEFTAALKEIIPRALALLDSKPQQLPENVELSGIFRFAHRLDSLQRWQEQGKSCNEARQRLLGGEDFARVAAAMSQGATKELGGRLGHRFLDPLDELDQQLARLQPQEISPVFEVDNGFWCFRLENRTPGKPMPFHDMPWEAKRILLRQSLNQLMEN